MTFTPVEFKIMYLFPRIVYFKFLKDAVSYEGKWSPTPEMFFKAIKYSSYQLFSGTVVKFVFFFVTKTFFVNSYTSCRWNIGRYSKECV